jgi:hypothetical protein
VFANYPCVWQVTLVVAMSGADEDGLLRVDGDERDAADVAAFQLQRTEPGVLVLETMF